MVGRWGSAKRVVHAAMIACMRSRSRTCHTTESQYTTVIGLTYQAPATPLLPTRPLAEHLGFSSPPARARDHAAEERPRTHGRLPREGGRVARLAGVDLVFPSVT